MTSWAPILRRAFFLPLIVINSSVFASIGFFSTGVDDNGNLIADGTADSHYSLFYAGTQFSYDTAYATTNNPSSWLPRGTDYQWINPTGDGTDDLPCRGCDTAAPGYAFPDYFYSTSFDLSGVNLSDVYIEFDIASDNAANVNINGRYINRYDGFGAFRTVVLNDQSWFVDGLNTIEFGVLNSGSDVNPTGLMVRVTQARIPEPGVLTLLGLGFATFGLRRGMLVNRSRQT